MQIISKIMKIKYVSHDPITKAMHREHHNSCWCFNIPFAEYFRLFSLNILLVISLMLYFLCLPKPCLSFKVQHKFTSAKHCLIFVESSYPTCVLFPWQNTCANCYSYIFRCFYIFYAVPPIIQHFQSNNNPLFQVFVSSFTKWRDKSRNVQDLFFVG